MSLPLVVQHVPIYKSRLCSVGVRPLANMRVNKPVVQLTVYRIAHDTSAASFTVSLFLMHLAINMQQCKPSVADAYLYNTWLPLWCTLQLQQC